jgi:Ca2+-binding RTX toxin-like protein
MLYRTLSAATVAEAGALAYAAYGYGGNSLADELMEVAPNWRGLTAGELGLDADDFREGFYDVNGAAGYVAVRASTLALVFRGSDSTEDLLDAAFDQDSYFDNLRDLIQAALTAAGDLGISHIVMTGQSLGGAMVQRTAALIDEFTVPTDIDWQMVTFGSAGTDIDDTTPFSRQVVNVAHTGDPVPDDPLLASRTQHGDFVSIGLPNVEGADNLAELGKQKAAQEDDPSIITEHDVLRYWLSAETIDQSSLADLVAAGTRAIVLDRADGSARDDRYRLDEGGFLLGGGGEDTLTGSAEADAIDGGGGRDSITGGRGKDTLAGGSGSDRLFGEGGDDTLRGGDGSDRLTGGAGNDWLDGGAGLDRIVYTATALNSGDVTAGGKDTIAGATGDRLDFAADLEALLKTGGTVLSALTDDTELGGRFSAGTNIRFRNGSDRIQIDLDGNGSFSSSTDFQILVPGASSLTYSAAGDFLILS